MSDPVSLLDAGLCRSPGGCAPVLPVIFTVFGDLANESWDQLRDVLPVGSGSELARVLLGALKILARNASEVHAASSELYRAQRP